MPPPIKKPPLVRPTSFEKTLEIKPRKIKFLKRGNRGESQFIKPKPNRPFQNFIKINSKTSTARPNSKHIFSARRLLVTGMPLFSLPWLIEFFQSSHPIQAFPFFLLLGVFLTGGRKLPDGSLELALSEEDPRLVLGREGNQAVGTQLSLDYEFIGEQHALFSRDPAGQFFITDLGSTNGTWVWMNRGWQRLTPLWPYPFQKGTRLAFGKVKGQEESLFLDKNRALGFEVQEGEGPNQIILSSRFFLINQKKGIPDNTREGLETEPHTLKGNYGSLTQFLKNWVLRPNRDPFLIQEKANSLENKGQFDKAELIHRKAVLIGRTLYKAASNLSPYTFNKPALDWGLVTGNYGDFLLRRGRREEAAAKFEKAGQLFLVANLNPTDEILRYSIKAKAYRLFRQLAEEAVQEENSSLAAVFYERAGYNVPWTFEGKFLGDDWDPLVIFIQMKAQSALYYRWAGEDYQDPYQKVWRNLAKVTRYVKPEAFQLELGKFLSALKQLVDEKIIRPEEISSFVETEIDLLRLKFEAE